MRHIIIFAFCVLLLGCTREVYVPVVRSERIIDTITRVAPDSTMVTALFECDSIGRVRLREIEMYKGRTAAQEFTFADGSLKIETRWRTQFVDRVREVRDTVTVVETRTETQVIKKIPIFFWICFGLCVVVILYIVYRVIKR